MAEEEPTPSGTTPGQEAWQTPDTTQPTPPPPPPAAEAPMRPFEERTPQEQQTHLEATADEIGPAVQDQIDILTAAKNAGLDVEITKAQIMDKKQNEANVENAIFDKARDKIRELLTAIINDAKVEIQIDHLVAETVFHLLGESGFKINELRSLVGNKTTQLEKTIGGRRLFVKRDSNGYVIIDKPTT